MSQISGGSGRMPMGRVAIARPAVRRILVVGALVAASAVALPGPAGSSPVARAAAPRAPFIPAAATFQVGQAIADVTPPLSSTATGNAAACLTPAQRATFNGPHLLALEEAYQDTNHNGRWDSGEPFVDCPTPLVNGGSAPPDHRWDGIMLGGGDGGPRQPTAVLDHIFARTIVVRSQGRTVALTSVDNEGIFKEIWEQILWRVKADHAPVDSMFFSSTHDESAPDTIGITGPNQLTSGVDPFYVQFLINRTAQSIEQAAAHLQSATIRYGMARPDNLVPCWSSYPFVANENIGAMQARSTDASHKVIFTLVNYGIHAEELGFSGATQDAMHLSSDWPHFARVALEGHYGGMALTVAGAVGSVEMPQVYPSTRNLDPVALHSSTGNGGCRTTYATDDTLTPYGYNQSTKARGDQIARWTETAIDNGIDSVTANVESATKVFFVPLDNGLFALGSKYGVIAGKTAYDNGKVVPRAADGSEIGGPGNEFQTAAFYLRIGDGGFVSAPGELFPYTFIRSYGGPADEAVTDASWTPPPWIMARMNTRWRFIVGLGNDMVGYIFPSTNAVGVPTATNLNPPDQDRFGCGHSDDGEAASGRAGDLVANQLVSIMPASVDTISTGRYVWSDGSLHRSPMGEGGQACTGAGNTFTPAPAGSPTGIKVGSTVLPVDGVNLRWMDATGRPQAQANDQTRGVVDASGNRRWLDVFPAVAG